MRWVEKRQSADWPAVRLSEGLRSGNNHDTAAGLADEVQSRRVDPAGDQCRRQHPPLLFAVPFVGGEADNKVRRRDGVPVPFEEEVGMADMVRIVAVIDLQVLYMVGVR